MNFAKKCLRLIYPLRCAFCGKILKQGEICKPCADTLAMCIRNVGEPICKDNRQMDNIDVSLAGYNYTGSVKQAIHRMKFFSRQELAKFFAQNMLVELQACICIPKFDIIIFVPQGKKERKRRLYCVQQILANCLHRALSIPVADGVIIKKYDTPPQIHLGGEARRANLLGAFEVKAPHIIQDKNILIVDDILTTGATINECAKMLKYYGAKSCCSVCIAVSLIC